MLKSSLLISMLAALGGLAGLLSQLIIARTYGAGAALDGYLVIASVPTIVTGTFAAILNFTLVPELLRARDSVQEFAALSTALLKNILLLSLIVAAGGCLVAAPLTTALLPAQPPELTAWLCRLSWLGAALMLILSYLGCVLNAARSFYAGIFVAALPPLGIATAVLLLGPRLGIVAVPLGSALGAAAGVLLLLGMAWKLMAAHGGRMHAMDLRAYLLGLPGVVVAMSGFFLYAGIDAWWAPLAGVGALSYLAYAQRLLIAAGNLVGLGPLSTIATLMADDHGRNGTDAAHSRLMQAVIGTVVAAAGLAVVSAGLAHPIVLVLFQRGSFDAAATAGVAGLLPLMMAGMVAMLGMSILMKGLFQLRLRRMATLLGLAWALVYFCGSGLLVRPLGAQGIALVYALSWWSVFGAGLWLLLRHAAQPGLGRQLLISLSCVLVASVFALLALNAADYWAGYSRAAVVTPGLLGATTMAGIAGLAAYALVYWRVRGALLRRRRDAAHDTHHG